MPLGKVPIKSRFLTSSKWIPVGDLLRRSAASNMSLVSCRFLTTWTTSRTPWTFPPWENESTFTATGAWRTSRATSTSSSPTACRTTPRSRFSTRQLSGCRTTEESSSAGPAERLTESASTSPAGYICLKPQNWRCRPPSPGRMVSRNHLSMAMLKIDDWSFFKYNLQTSSGSGSSTAKTCFYTMSLCF